MILIYVLKRDNIPFYIGKCNNINIRYSQHKKKYGSDINIEILEVVEDKEWKVKEKYYILLFKSKGFKLENKNNGGGGSSSLTDISKEKISKSKIGNNYKLNRIPKNNIENLYKTKGIYDICKELNLTYNTVRKYLECKNLYIPNNNRKVDNKTTKLKKSIANKGKRSRSVEQYDLQNNKLREFPSITEACLFLNKIGRIGDINSVCLGKQKTAFGYIWKYKEN
jgi:hypothetical protein